MPQPVADKVTEKENPFWARVFENEHCFTPKLVSAASAGCQLRIPLIISTKSHRDLDLRYL
jgi:hypothetical protein